MDITIIWDNPTRSLIDRAEFGKKLSFKNKLGFKPGSLSRSVQMAMPEKINMAWKRELAARVNDQFQMNRKATIYVQNDKIKHSGFVISARNSLQFSNLVANGILRLRALISGKLTIENIIDKGYQPLKPLV